MNLEEILKPLTRAQLDTLSRSDLIELVLGEQHIRQQLEEFAKKSEEQRIEIEGKYVRIKNRTFEPKTEVSPDKRKGRKQGPPKPPKNRELKPSERYPNVPVVEKDVELEELPKCESCEATMHDSGMCEVRETLTVKPRKYEIVRHYYHKYACKGCHGAIVTTPTIPKIKKGSSYSDELMIDVAMSKYCDLIPIERYVAIAGRLGIKGIPAQSLIELTHYLAQFLTPIYEMLREEVRAAKVLHADETPHRMLEGHEKKRWYFWGFSSNSASYFECHPTRSGDVASEFLKGAACSYLLTDVFSGYWKAVQKANEERAELGLTPILPAYCNAHARRKYWEIKGDDGQPFLDLYEKIYRIESQCKDLSVSDRFEQRQSMRPLFTEIRSRSQELLELNSSKSGQAKAANYFLNNYEGLTKFLDDGHIPIDNNSQERQLRNPVIGRKTWLGTHSERGAETASILFSIVESCKLLKINPRQYVADVVNDMLAGKEPNTPYQYDIK